MVSVKVRVLVIVVVRFCDVLELADGISLCASTTQVNEEEADAAVLEILNIAVG